MSLATVAFWSNFWILNFPALFCLRFVISIQLVNLTHFRSLYKTKTNCMLCDYLHALISKRIRITYLARFARNVLNGTYRRFWIFGHISFLLMIWPTQSSTSIELNVELVFAGSCPVNVNAIRVIRVTYKRKWSWI